MSGPKRVKTAVNGNIVRVYSLMLTSNVYYIAGHCGVPKGLNSTDEANNIITVRTLI